MMMGSHSLADELNTIPLLQIVLDSFRKEGFEFALKAFNSSRFLEDLTGITELLQDHQGVLESNEDDFELSD